MESARHAQVAELSADAHAVPVEAPDPGGLDHDTEEFDHVVENDFVVAARQPLSTFSVDVDTASYAIVRRFLQQQSALPPAGAVRVEELVNYFDYAYPPPKNDRPFAVDVAVTDCPWKPEHRLVRIGLQGREVESHDRGRANLVFLLDCSGSMSDSDKLPLVKESMRLLLGQLEPDDRVAIVTYAGSAGLALDSTPVGRRAEIEGVVDTLSAGGSTAGSGGIQVAYRVAAENFVEEGVNRVALCTDGDFNVGITNQSDLVDLIEQNAESGVFLSVLGFGSGNYKDSTMEKLADHGNGNYGYVDTLNEARKTLVEEVEGTLVTIAKDVKIQVDFNRARVAAYRLIGYENRMLAAEDFLDDRKDAGEIGAGHTVTALYEVVPPGVEIPAAVRPSKYAKTGEGTNVPDELASDASNELLTVRLRYKQPDRATSTGFDHPVEDASQPFEQASSDTRFAAAVASFGMLLRRSKHAGSATYDTVAEIASGSLGNDPNGYRAEFVALVKRARQLDSGR